MERKRLLAPLDDRVHKLFNIKIPMNIHSIEKELFKNETEISSIEIPSTITSLERNIFKTCEKLKKLKLPEIMINLDYDIFYKSTQLKELTISSKYELHGNKLFIVKDGELSSLLLPSELKTINEKEIELKELTSYTIPRNVTKLGDYCFYRCKKLTEIHGLEQIKEFGKYTLTSTMKNNFDKLQLSKKDKMRILYGLSEEEIKQLEEWCELECQEVVFDSIIHNWSKRTSEFNDKIMGKKNLLFLIEDENDQIFGYYLNGRIPYYNEFGNNVQREPGGTVYLVEEVGNKTFHFNLKSNGRIPKPMKFEIIDTKRNVFELFDPGHPILICLGDIYLEKSTKQFDECKTFQDETTFNYHGIPNALSGIEKIRFYGTTFIIKRFIVIQMG